MATISGRLKAYLGRIGPTLVLFAAAVFFIAPILSTARAAFHKVPTILLNRHTWFEKWSFEGLRRAFKEDYFWPTLSLSLKLAVATVLITMLLLVPTALFVHLKLPRARALVEFLTVLPYVVPPIAKSRGSLFVNSLYASFSAPIKSGWSSGLR